MIQKTSIDISFAQGLSQKDDKKRLSVGKFLKLENSIFEKGGLLQKRNGYASLSTLPNNSNTYLTTLNGNLTAVGSSVTAFNEGNDGWVTKGSIAPLQVKTLPLITNNLNQTQCDAVVAPNGLVLVTYTETNGSTTTHKFAVSDSVTGQNIVAPQVIPVTSGTVTGSSRAFVLGNNFVVVFTNDISGTYHLQYITVGIYNQVISTNQDIASNYTPASTVAWDGYVNGTYLYIAYNTTSGGQSVLVTALTTSGVVLSPTRLAGYVAVMMSVTVDVSIPTTPFVYVSFSDSSSGVDNFKFDQNLNLLTSAGAIYSVVGSAFVLNIASAAQNGSCTVFIEILNNYGFDSSVPTHYIDKITVTGTSAVGLLSVRSVGLASKAFVVSGVVYYLAAYQSAYQPTYFLMNGSLSTQASPVVSAKFAYQNGGGYLTLGLPAVTVLNGNQAWVSYLFKDLIQAVNKNTNIPTGNQTAGVYSQTGITLGTLTFTTQELDTAEIGQDLHLTGGFLWMYDGYLPVEHNFFLWPDTDTTNPTDMASWLAGPGNIVAQPPGWVTGVPTYYYQFTYEWTDNKGNAFRSAPSIPISVITGSGTTGSIQLNIPTLRLTYKTANPVKIVVYRWSVAQQNYYQTTSITSPVLNDTTVDYVQFVDTNADSSILGNNLIYTTGGVVEDVNAPASNLLTLFDTRLWLVDAEDPNLLWFSKQVIESTPVEMSDLFTMYIPPTTATQGSTGPITSIAPMDDKLIIGKENAFLYVNGAGPDNTGANNQYSEPIFITATVGCTNQQSIVLIPQGLMFQSDKGIWLLGRDLSTNYIGAPVEDLTTGALVTSAVNVPATNQVRFTLDSGITLMYDYYFQQWGTFTGVPAVSSCIFQGLHTYITSAGTAFQEQPGTYLDGSNPTQMMFQTGPINFGTLQGYQRAYFFYLLGTYLSPHKLAVSVTYDYADTPSQTFLISPTNFAPAYGQPGPYGQGNPYGGPGNAENWRVFLQQQRCQAISITVQEIYDPTLGVPAGAGLTLSGLNVILGFKRGFRPQPNVNSVG